MHRSEQEQLKMGTATTLDEDVYTTVMRDMKQVAAKLQVVLLPLGHNNESSVIEKLREWDLWGPLLVCLLLLLPRRCMLFVPNSFSVRYFLV